MSEEKIKEIIKDFLELREIHSSDSMRKSYLSIYQEAIQGLLDLYKAEKEKNKKFQEQILNRFERICPHCNNKFIAKKKNTVYCKRCTHLVASLAWQRRNREKVRQYNRQRYKKIKNIKEE